MSDHQHASQLSRPRFGTDHSDSVWWGTLQLMITCPSLHSFAYWLSTIPRLCGWREPRSNWSCYHSTKSVRSAFVFIQAP